MTPEVERWQDDHVSITMEDSLEAGRRWPEPNVIISDGAYGVGGFPGDPPDHRGLTGWYEPHVRAWSDAATAATTLWFWNSEIGWATVHPLLEAHGWRYIHANIWNKGKAHLAGKSHSPEKTQFPVVSEVCAQYVFQPRINGIEPKQWLLQEWRRTGLPLNRANEACGVANAATRKYLDQTNLWYPPPPKTFHLLQEYANLNGDPAGRPYFAPQGGNPATAEDWQRIAAHPRFECPYGFTNIWDRPPLRGAERITRKGRTAHPNQKPLDLITMIIRASSPPGGTVWEPFGGLFTAAIAARNLERHAWGAESDPQTFQAGRERLAATRPLAGILNW